MRVTVPGRINLIGEHIDYHNLPILPLAIQRRICIDYEERDDSVLKACSENYGNVQIDIKSPLTLEPAGSWKNYISAAVAALSERWTIHRGIEATVTSDLPPAAGLSSSSALLTGFTLALLRANGFNPTVSELMDILPDGEQFVGTRGGGMDHAAVLASEPGCALLIEFAPLRLTPVPIPDSWQFIVAHSLTTAEKSGEVREQFNSRRKTGQSALEKSRAGLALSADETRAYRHITTEAQRVHDAVCALKQKNKELFGALLCESHRSLRDDLRVSCDALDELVDVAMQSGALGARLTGAGFGGCAVVFCETANRETVAEGLIKSFYANRPAFSRETHLIFATPSAGALHA